MKPIVWTPHEIQSNHSRVKFAEDLISQLPASHEGRNTWLMNYGMGDEAMDLRERRKLNWVEETQAAEGGTFRPKP